MTLKVSLGTQWVTVPDVKTYVSDDAKKTLQDSGLQVVSKYVEDESVAAGTVVYTEPAGGETVEGGSTVNMYIARSKRDNMVSVTSVTGLQVSEGTADLQRQNLVVSVVEQPSSEAEGHYSEPGNPLQAPRYASAARCACMWLPQCRKLCKTPAPRILRPLVMVHVGLRKLLTITVIHGGSM